MTEEEHLTAAMNTLAPFSYALEEFVGSVGWRAVRASTVGDSGISWTLWLPEQLVPPATVLVLDGQNVHLHYRHRMATFNLADPDCFEKLEKHLAKLERATRAIIDKRTAHLRGI